MRKHIARKMEQNAIAVAAEAPDAFGSSAAICDPLEN
jgi:hypothetical protein